MRSGHILFYPFPFLEMAMYPQRPLVWIPIALALLLPGLCCLAQDAGGAQPIQGPGAIYPAITILEKSKKQFANIQDYECLVVKRERIGSQLQPETTLEMKVRSHPLSVYFKGVSPKSERGMEISYVEGRNNGLMRLHLNGFAGLVGFFSIAPDDSRVMQKTRHSITKAGLANLLEGTARHLARETDPEKTRVTIVEEQVGERVAYCIETVHPELNRSEYYGHRCYIWIDKDSLMPIGSETYDWPKPGGLPGGDLLESYRFRNLRVNTGIPDAVFFK